MAHKKLTEEHKERIRNAIKQRWIDGKQEPVKRCPFCNAFMGINHNCKEIKEKQRQAKLENPTRYWLGKKRSKELIEKLRQANLNRVYLKGKESNSWTGGSSKWWHERAREVIEKHLGRKLIKGEIIHHINENWKDNRIENLKVVSRKEHIKIHKPKR